MTWLLFIAGAVVIFFIVKNKKTDISAKNEAEEELKKRYVNGEIDDETYIKMKENLRK